MRQRDQRDWSDPPTSAQLSVRPSAPDFSATAHQAWTASQSVAPTRWIQAEIAALADPPQPRFASVQLFRPGRTYLLDSPIYIGASPVRIAGYSEESGIRFVNCTFEEPTSNSGRLMWSDIDETGNPTGGWRELGYTVADGVRWHDEGRAPDHSTSTWDWTDNHSATMTFAMHDDDAQPRLSDDPHAWDLYTPYNTDWSLEPWEAEAQSVKFDEVKTDEPVPSWLAVDDLVSRIDALLDAS